MPPAAIRNLTERRVPQFLAVYLGASWGLVQFVDFIGTRYALSPRWTDLTLLAMLLLLPSVLLYTYHHGRPGPDEWQRSEKIFIPINLLALFGILFSIGASTNLSAVTTRVKVKDEKGNTVERVVASKAYRKRVMLFNFEVADKQAQWMSVAAPMLTLMDLQQQQFIQPMPPIDPQIRQKLLESGFKDGTGAPFTLQRKLADERHIPHFLTGEISPTTNAVNLKVKLYETSSGKLLTQHNFTAPTLSDAIDMVSTALVKDLNVPVLSDGKPDLPVADLTTQNQQALRACFDALRLALYENNFVGAQRLLKNATTIDPTFAWAQLQLFGLSIAIDGKADMTAIQSALDNSYRLPERTQQFVKSAYFQAKLDYPRAFAVIDMLSKLYPEDLEVLEQKVEISAYRDDKDAIIESLKKILELDPTRAEMQLTLGKVYESRGDAQNALSQYNSYAKKFPNDVRSQRSIANLYHLTGDAGKARAAYEQALLAKPSDVTTLVSLASLERKHGNFDTAMDELNQALSASKSPQDRFAALSGLIALQEFTGQFAKSTATRSQAISEAAKFQAPAQLLWLQMQFAAQSAKVDAAKATNDVAKLRKQIGPFLDVFMPVVDQEVYWAQQDSAGAEKTANALDRVVTTTSMAVFKPIALQAHGRAAELRGDYAGAVRWYEQVQKLAPLEVDMQLDIGRCYRKANQFGPAEKALARVLRVSPADGEANLEMALLYKQRNDLARAKQFAATALKTWQNADANHPLAKQARAI